MQNTLLINGPFVYVWDWNIPQGMLGSKIIELYDSDLANHIAQFAAVSYPIKLLLPDEAQLFKAAGPLRGGDSIRVKRDEDGKIIQMKKVKVYSEEYYLGLK